MDPRAHLFCDRSGERRIRCPYDAAEPPIRRRPLDVEAVRLDGERRELKTRGRLRERETSGLIGRQRCGRRLRDLRRSEKLIDAAKDLAHVLAMDLDGVPDVRV